MRRYERPENEQYIQFEHDGEQYVERVSVHLAAMLEGQGLGTIVRVFLD